MIAYEALAAARGTRRSRCRACCGRDRPRSRCCRCGARATICCLAGSSGSATSAPPPYRPSIVAVGLADAHADDGVGSEVGRLRTVAAAPSGRRAAAADAAQQRRPALRRAAVGRARAGRARRLRRGAARPRCRGPLPGTSCWRRRSTTARSARADGRCTLWPHRPSGPSLAAVLRQCLLGLSATELAARPGRRADPRGAAAPRPGGRRPMAGAGEFVVRPLPNLLFTRDSVGLGRRPRRGHAARRCTPASARAR